MNRTCDWGQKCVFDGCRWVVRNLCAGGCHQIMALDLNTHIYIQLAYSPRTRWMLVDRTERETLKEFQNEVHINDENKLMFGWLTSRCASKENGMVNARWNTRKCREDPGLFDGKSHLRFRSVFFIYWRQ